MIQAKKLKFIIAKVVIIFAITLVKTQAQGFTIELGQMVEKIRNEGEAAWIAIDKVVDDGKGYISGEKISPKVFCAHIFSATNHTLAFVNDTNALVNAVVSRPVSLILPDPAEPILGISAGEGSDSLNQTNGVWIRSGMTQAAQKAYGSTHSSTLHKEGTKLGANADR